MPPAPFVGIYPRSPVIGGSCYRQHPLDLVLLRIKKKSRENLRIISTTPWTMEIRKRFMDTNFFLYRATERGIIDDGNRANRGSREKEIMERRRKKRLPDSLSFKFHEVKSELCACLVASFPYGFRQHHVIRADFHINPREEYKWKGNTNAWNFWSHKNLSVGAKFRLGEVFPHSFHHPAIILSSNHRHTFRAASRRTFGGGVRQQAGKSRTAKELLAFSSARRVRNCGWRNWQHKGFISVLCALST